MPDKSDVERDNVEWVQNKTTSVSNNPSVMQELFSFMRDKPSSVRNKAFLLPDNGDSVAHKSRSVRFKPPVMRA